jgi:hypothetical protein
MEMLKTSRRRLLGVGLAAMLAILPATAGVAQAQGASNRNAPVAIPVTAPGFVGNFNVQRFANRNGSVVAIGTLVGTVTDTTGAVLGNVAVPLALPVQAQQTTATCQVLHLVLGPLDLNLLGVHVQLNQVVLNIEAIPGAGNLLGNLLCAITGLLDGANPLGGLAALLNNLLAALGSL